MDMFVHIFVLACLTCIINGSYIPLRLSPSPTPSFTPSPFRQISQLYKGPFQGTLPPIPLIMPRPGIAMYSFPVLPLPSPWTSPPPLFTPIVPVSSHRSSDTRNRARSVGPVRTTAKGGYDYARGSLTASSNTGSTRPATYDRVHVHVAAPLVPTAKFSFNTQIRIPNTHVKGSLDMPVGFIINTADVGVNSPRVALVDGIPANMQVEGVASSHENTQSTRPPGVMNSGPSHQYQDITQSNMGSQRRTPTNAREPGSLTLGLQMDNQLGSSYEMKQMSNYRSEQGLLAQSNVQSHRARSSTRPGQTPSGPQQNSENYGRSGNIVFLQGSKQHSISQPEVMQGVVHSMASQAGQTHNEPKVISSEPNLYESTQNVVFDFTPKEVSGSLYDQQTYQPTQTVYSRHRSETGTEYQYASGIVNSISAMNPATAAASTEAQTKSSDRVNVLQDVNINRRMEAFDAQPDGGVVGRNIIKTTSKDMRGIDTLGTSKEVPSIQGATSSDMKNTMQARAANGNQVDVSAGRPGVEQSSVLTVGQEKMNHASAQHDNQHLGHNLLSNQAASTGDLSTSGGQQYISNQVAATNGQYGAVDLSPSGTQQSLSHQIASTSEQYSTGDLSMSGGQQSIVNQAASTSGQYATGDMSASGGQQSTSNQAASIGDLSTSGRQQSIHDQAASTNWQYSTGDLSNFGGQQSVANQTASTSGQYTIGDVSASGGQKSTANQAAATADLSTSGGQQYISNQVASTNGQYSTGDLSMSGGQQSISSQAVSTSEQYTTGDVSASGGLETTSNQVAATGHLLTSGRQQSLSDQITSTSGQYATADLSTSGGQQSISNQVAATNGQYGAVDLSTSGRQQSLSDQMTSTSEHYSTGDLSMPGGQQSISSQAVSTSGQYTTGDVSPSGGLETTSNQAAATGHLLTSGRQQSLSDQIASTSGQYTIGDLSTSGGHQSIPDQNASTHGQYATADLSTSGGHQSIPDQTASTNGQYATADLSTSRGHQSISSQAVSTSGQYTTGDVSASGGLETISNQAAATGHLLTSGRQQSLSDQIASTSGQYATGDLSTSGGQQSIFNQAAAGGDLSTSGGKQSIPDQAASTNGQNTIGDLSTSGGQQSISNQAASTNGQYGAVDLSTAGRQQSLSDQITSTSGQYTTGDMSTIGRQQSISNQPASVSGQYEPVDFPAPAGHQPAPSQGLASRSDQYGAVDLLTSGGQQLASAQATTTSEQYNIVDIQTSGGQQSVSNHAASPSEQYGSVDVSVSTGQQLIPSQVVTSTGEHRTVAGPSRGQVTRDQSLHQGITPSSTQHGTKDMTKTLGTQVLHDLTQTTTNNGISTRPVQQDAALGMNKIKQEIPEQPVGHATETSSMVVGLPQLVNDQTNLNQYLRVSPVATDAADHLGSVERQYLKNIDLQGQMPIVAGAFGVNGAIGETQDTFHNHVQSGLTGQGRDSVSGHSGMQEIHSQSGAPDLVSDQGVISPVGQSLTQDMASNGNQYDNLDLSGGQGWLVASGQYAPVESTRPNTATVATGESTYTVPTLFPAQDSRLAINNHLEKEVVTEQSSVGTRNILQGGIAGTSLETEFMSLLLQSRSQDAQSTNTHYDPLVGQGNVNATQLLQRNHVLKNTNTFNASKESSRIENTRSGFSVNKPNSNTVSIPSNRQNPHLPVLNEVDTLPILPSSTRAHDTSIQTTFEINPVTKTASGTNHKASSLSSAQKADKTVGNDPIDIRIAPATIKKTKDSLTNGISSRITEDTNASATERARMAVRSDTSLSLQKTSPIQSMTRPSLKSFDVFQPMEYGGGQKQKSNQMFDSSLPSVISETTVPAFATRHQEFISFPQGLFDYTAVNGQGGGYTGTTDYGPITNDVMQFLSTQGFSTLDAYLQNELSQTLDSPVPYTSSSSSASSQGSTSGTGTTAVKTLTQSQPNQLPPDTVASPAIDVHNPPLAESSQQDAQTHDAVNDIKMQNVATKPLDNSNNMVFDVAMGVQGQNTQHSFKNQEGTLRTGRSTKAVISESIVDPLLNAPQVTATRLSPDESGFISMTGTGHTKSKMSLQGHSHQRQTMKLSGIQMLPQGMSGHLMGSQTGQGEPTKTFGLKMNVNTGGFSSGTSHQSSSAGTTTTSFNSQHDVGGVEWDPNQPSSATTNSLPSIPIPTDAYSSQQLTDMNVGDTHLGTPLTSTEADPRNVKSSSLLTSVANEMPSFTADLHSTFSGVQASSSAGQVMSTSEGSKAGVSDFNRGLDSATWNGQPDSTAAHQKITEAPEFYEPAPRYVDSDQGDSGDGQEMSQNTVNTEPTKYNFDVSKDRQMSPHDGQQVLSNTERSSGYADYFPSTSLSSR
ncbi:serine-rich adhesin for platelets-like isoform X2 [Haliotis asinina]|uniref:serine-rich adhesin for platelets-like isoform X2 n=1 Tax=Haliotis asinina TaxID=109174 RepID=UPI0035323B0C